MTLASLGVLKLAWRGTSSLGWKGVIHFLYAHCMIENECLSYLTYIHDTSISLPNFMDFV